MTAFVMCFLSIASVSGLTQLTLYVDNVGDALFLGTTDVSSLSLPAVVKFSEGQLYGYTSELTRKEGDIWTFSYALQDSELLVVLPKGALIKNISEGEITLQREQLAVYARDSIIISYTIEDIASNKSDFIIPALLILGALLLLGVIYMLNVHRREKRYNKKLNRPPHNSHAKKELLLRSLLHEREHLILKKLKKTGAIKMSYLRKKCDIPKASFSRHVHELEKKKLVKLSGEGKNKTVTATSL